MVQFAKTSELKQKKGTKIMENQKIGKKKNKLWMLQLLACMLAMVCMVSMGNNARYVPVQILQETIKTGTATVDTQGSSAMMYTTPMYKMEVCTI